MRRRLATPQKRARARQLRRAQTPAEVTLWQALRTFPDARFARQFVVEGFIADFYCRPARLVIEVDGDVHDAQQDHDRARDEVLRAAGHRVVRYRNEQVQTDLARVLDDIRRHLRG